VQHIRDAILSGTATPEDYANIEIPDHYLGCRLRLEEKEMFEGLGPKDRDPRKSLRIESVPLP